MNQRGDQWRRRGDSRLSSEPGHIPRNPRPTSKGYFMSGNIHRQFYSGPPPRGRYPGAYYNKVSPMSRPPPAALLPPPQDQMSFSCSSLSFNNLQFSSASLEMNLTLTERHVKIIPVCNIRGSLDSLTFQIPNSSLSSCRIYTSNDQKYNRIDFVVLPFMSQLVSQGLGGIGASQLGHIAINSRNTLICYLSTPINPAQLPNIQPLLGCKCSIEKDDTDYKPFPVGKVPQHQNSDDIKPQIVRVLPPAPPQPPIKIEPVNHVEDVVLPPAPSQPPIKIEPINQDVEEVDKGSNAVPEIQESDENPLNYQCASFALKRWVYNTDSEKDPSNLRININFSSDFIRLIPQFELKMDPQYISNHTLKIPTTEIEHLNILGRGKNFFIRFEFSIKARFMPYIDAWMLRLGPKMKLNHTPDDIFIVMLKNAKAQKEMDRISQLTQSHFKCERKRKSNTKLKMEDPLPDFMTTDAYEAKVQDKDEGLMKCHSFAFENLLYKTWTKSNPTFGGRDKFKNFAKKKSWENLPMSISCTQSGIKVSPQPIVNNVGDLIKRKTTPEHFLEIPTSGITQCTMIAFVSKKKKNQAKLFNRFEFTLTEEYAGKVRAWMNYLGSIVKENVTPGRILDILLKNDYKEERAKEICKIFTPHFPCVFKVRSGETSGVAIRSGRIPIKTSGQDSVQNPIASQTLPSTSMSNQNASYTSTSFADPCKGQIPSKLRRMNASRYFD